MLPYHGLGSGITRALDEWPEIDFIDDREGCLFKAIVHRKKVDGKVLPTVSGETSGKVSGKTPGKILEAILQNNTITIPELSLRRSLN
jgi:ATP-dependent DNA helicase RecG